MAPDPSEQVRARIARAGVALLRRRGELCEAEDIGLTRLYNLVADGAFREIASLQAELDAAVSGAYGWSPDLDEAQRNASLLELHRELISADLE